MGRIVSIDYGLARIGMAISDEMKVIATSLGVVTAEKTVELTIQKILALLEPYSVDLIIVGLPLHMNGKTGFLADEVKHFISLLEKIGLCPIVAWDERLSTVQAERALREGNLSRKKRSKVIDAVTAMILLQSYLEFESLKTSL